MPFPLFVPPHLSRLLACTSILTKYGSKASNSWQKSFIEYDNLILAPVRAEEYRHLKTV